MAGNLKDLANFCTGLANDLPVQINLLSKKVVLTIVSELAYVTPVDTSNALSNWQVSINEPILEEIPPYFPGKYGSTRTASAQKTVEEAAAVLVDKKPGQTVYIVNNAPYIDLLNMGKSSQADPMFVERAALLSTVTVGNFKLRT